MANTVTTKGQVTIPQPLRERLGIVAGSKVEFTLADDGRIVMTKVGGEAPPSRFERLKGIAGSGPTTDELMAMLRD